jgi:hypothetical protein
MNMHPRIPLVAALAACLSLTIGACNRDEPATYQPQSGEWEYLEQTVDSDTCNPDSLPDPWTAFSLDYDGGDSFQVELGENDVSCEIDGTEFYCSDFVIDNPVDNFNATIRYAVTWEGEFRSRTEAEGKEIAALTCIGEDCPGVELLLNLPCTRTVSFEANAL